MDERAAVARSARALVVAGVLLSVAALLRVPKVSRLPLSLALVTHRRVPQLVAAHTHNYPGRMSIHLAPFAVAMTVTAGARWLAR